MFKTFFSKISKAAYSSAQNHTNKQNFIKKMNNIKTGITTTNNIKINYSIQSTFSTLDCQNMQINNLILKSTPLGNAVALNIMNLRQILQKCKQQTQLQSYPSTTKVYDLVSMGIIDSNVLSIIDSCKKLTPLKI